MTGFPSLPVPSAPERENEVYPNFKIGGFKAGDHVRIGQSPYVFYVHAVWPGNWVWLNVPGMTGRYFAVAIDCVERVVE